MKNIKKMGIFFIALISMILVGCDEEPEENKPDIEQDITFEVELMNEETQYQIISDLKKDDWIVLPALDNKENLMFVGWSDGENVYYGDYQVEKDVVFYAHYEDPSEVFDLFVIEEYQPLVQIQNYTGIGKYLKVPQYIDGNLVVGLGSGAMIDSNIIEIILPMDSTIGAGALAESKELKSVTFYGEILKVNLESYSSSEFDALLADYGDTCVINESTKTEKTWEYNKECPIKEVIDVYGMVLEGIEYYTYTVLMRESYGNIWNMGYAAGALSHCEKLETIEIPLSMASNYGFCTNCPSLKEIIVDENHPLFAVKDGILYSGEFRKIEMYPAALNATAFALPLSVERVSVHAFNSGSILERIIIGPNVSGHLNFSDLQFLKEIIVDDQNNEFFSNDGVLYKHIENGIALIQYPVSKEGSNYITLDNTTDIYPFAFGNNKYLESIEFNEELVMVRDFAFKGSKKLSVLEFPASTVYFGTRLLMESNVETVIINKEYEDGNFSMHFWIGLYANNEVHVYLPDDSYDDYSFFAPFKENIDFVHKISEYTE